MASVSTPTSIKTEASISAPANTIDVGFVNNNANGNSKFNIQFIKIGDPGAEVILAPGNPVVGTPPTANPDTTPWSVPVEFINENALPTGVTISDLVSKYQTEIQADADSPNTPSDWGKQIYYHIGLTVTILIGGVKVVLGESTVPNVYGLSSPVTVTYNNLKDFVHSLPGDLPLPTHWPNGSQISSSLTVETFNVNTSTKLFDINVVANLDWTIIDGILKADKVGIEVIRTNGQPI